jgi:anaerobic selenocysteine-containing dehydrogenase
MMGFKVDRRDFMRFAAGGALGTATSGVTLRGISRVNEALANEEVRVPGGPETWTPGVCTLCPAGCGLRVRKIGPRAVKVQGNPLHPVNQGGLCPKGLAQLQMLYHPDRLRSPMKNTGSRKSPRWKQISWDDAISMLVAQFRKLHGAGQNHTVVFIDRNEQTLASRLMRRFMAAYGSPNYLVLPSGLDALKTAVYLQQGVTLPVAYDWERTRYVLSFGVNLLEGWGSPASIMRAFGRWRDPSSGRRTKFVQVEPRLSLTAARADEWVSLKPGTEAALALGIAYVLITEGLYDAAFLRERTFGFEDWRDASGRMHQGFRSLVLSEYRLQDVAALTGVPEEIILRLGREFGNNRPAMALGDPQTSTLAGNPYSAMAVHSLNALVGSVDAPGGVLVQADFPTSEETADKSKWPRLDQTAANVFPGRHLAELPRAIAGRAPYPVQALILNEANPVFSMPTGSAFAQCLEQVPFVASFATFLDESSVLADLVLPTQTDLEKWQAVGSPPTFPYALQSIAAPAVAPRHQTRQPADVILEVARRLGGPVARALPFATFEEYLRSQVKDLFGAQTGSVFSTSLEEAWNRLLERSGWWSPTFSTADELWDQMQKQGGWWDPGYYYGEWQRVLKTPSGRFEFYSQTLARWATSHPEFARNAGMEPSDDRLFLPHQPRTAEPPPGYPLLLLPIEVLPLAGGEGAQLPFLQQIAGPHLFEAWESWLEIHPETANKLRISDGDLVWIESQRGRAQVRIRLYAGARPGVVHLPLGYGHTVGSQWGRGGVNPLSLLEERREPVAGLPQSASTYVRVYPS